MHPKIPLFLVFLIVSLSVIDSANCQGNFAANHNISYITIEDGLLHNNVSNIYKDKLGFIWIATKGGGLSRFDGYDFVHFNASTSKENLSSNFVTAVCEDDFNRLWILSEEATDILDLKTLKITSPTLNHPEVLSEPARNIIKDRNGNIWLCTTKSLHKIYFDKNGQILSVFTLHNLPDPSSKIVLKDIDEDGNIWLANGTGIFKVFTVGENKLKVYPILTDVKFDISASFSDIQKVEKEIWIGTTRGLCRYDKRTSRTRWYRHKSSDKHSLSQDYITDLITDKNGKLMVSTLFGINVYNPPSDNFERITKEIKGSESHLNSDFVTCMLADDETIWIGCDVGGVNKFTPRRLSFHSYTHNSENPSSLSESLVNAIYEDHSGNLWVGTVEGGLNRKSWKDDKFVHYNTATIPAISHNTVSCILEDNQNRLWVGTWGWGITVLDLKDPRNRVLKYINPKENPAFPIAFIESLSYDQINNGIWIGANPGIFFYDLTKDKLINPFEPDITNKVPKALGAAIVSGGELWIGSVENGLFIIDLHSRKGDKFSFRHLKYRLDAPNSGIKERITNICHSVDGTVWVGSDGNGFYRYNGRALGAHSFTRFDSDDGLINNSVRGILEGDNGLIWISTNYGLSCFDPSTQTFSSFTREDGLINNQFYWNALHKSKKSGRIYFGGINGLTVIDGTRIASAEKSPKVVFTRLRIKNEEISAGSKGLLSDISRVRQLRIHERDNSFLLEFSPLDYNRQANDVYSYRLLGFEDEWIELSANRHAVNYTNLSPGKYIFQVKYTKDGRSNLNDTVSELSIIIKPFFFKTWWFIALTSLIVGSIVVYIYRRRLIFLQKQQILLQGMVEKRTAELTTQNIRINRQKEHLLKMSKKVQQLTLDKLSFFTNITHEFRTPITLIIGPIERALKLSQDPHMIEQLSLVERNSKYLLSLVNQLMDFRKVDSDNQKIFSTKGNLFKLLDAIVTSFEAFSTSRNISITKHYRISEPEFLFDHDAMQKTITNLLSNAIKFTPDGGAISIYVASIFPSADNEQLFICIRDTGIGIEEHHLPKIFDRFYQARSEVKYPIYGQSGTGIGLYLVSRIVELQKGTISVKNNKNGGCSFRIILPIERDSQSANIMEDSRKLAIASDEVDTSTTNFTTERVVILIVEDNSDMRKYIVSILKHHYNILEAENGVKAMSILIERNVDFIISDLMMPEMDGMELSRKVKQNLTISHIPFLMLTAKTSERMRLESYRIGVDEYIQKPFSEELLLARIHNILENRRAFHQRFHSSMKVNELQIDEKSKDKIFIEKLTETFKSNYKNPSYGRSTFIEDMGMSKSVLNKKMQSLMGQSIGQFMRNYRLNTAYELIKKNRLMHGFNIAEIAYEVGFNDPKYFTRCFVKRYGITPSNMMEKNISE
jgi:signal transduction histidine kinase/ligand-binding sensor domain-containing protein/DNA-binding NarL/FixJ family response regulator